MANQFQPQDPEPLVDGDQGFTGVDELTQPSQLTAGDVSEANNTRFTGSIAEPRLGVAKLPWTNRTNNQSKTPIPFSTIYGAIDFRDPDDLEWTIIAADGMVFRTRPNTGAVPLSLPSGVVINAPVTFAQTFNGLIMFRGATLPELVLTSIDTGFAVVDQTDNLISGANTENPTDGTEPIPFAANGDWIGNRLFIPFSKDLLGISDYMNATRYEGVRSQARINQGSEDALVRFFKFSDNSGLAFKEQSVYILNGITGDLSTMSLDEVTTAYGCAAAKSCVNIGSDVWFLSDRRGICSIIQTELNKVQGTDVPVSQKIRNLISRINWQYASTATAAYWDNKYYLSLPLDDATALGAELIPNGSVFDGSGNFFITIVVNASYRFTPGANELPTTVEQQDFTADQDFFQITGIPGAAVTASFKRTRVGVNNAVIVYDFNRQKWSGVDTGAAICVQEWVQLAYEGARRLFAISADGYINLYEEMLYDEVAIETMGDNILEDEWPFNLQYTQAVTPGGVYSYFPADASDLINGTANITTGGIFIAAGPTVTLKGQEGSQGSPIVSSIRPVTYTISPSWIQQDITLRGWTCGTVGRKRFIRVALELQTWFPEYTVYAITEGAAEQVAFVSNATKSFLKYDRPWDKPNWDQTNANNDHATKYRQDYAIVLGDDTTASGSIQAGTVYYVEDLDNPAANITYNGAVVTTGQTFNGVSGVTTFTVNAGSPVVYAPGNYIIPGSNGFNPDLTQESTEKLRVPLQTRGKQLQLRIVTTRGRVALLSAGCEAILSDQTMGTKL